MYRLHVYVMTRASHIISSRLSRTTQSHFATDRDGVLYCTITYYTYRDGVLYCTITSYTYRDGVLYCIITSYTYRVGVLTAQSHLIRIVLVSLPHNHILYVSCWCPYRTITSYTYRDGVLYCTITSYTYRVGVLTAQSYLIRIVMVSCTA